MYLAGVFPQYPLHYLLEAEKPSWGSAHPLSNVNAFLFLLPLFFAFGRHHSHKVGPLSSSNRPDYVSLQPSTLLGIKFTIPLNPGGQPASFSWVKQSKPLLQSFWGKFLLCPNPWCCNVSHPLFDQMFHQVIFFFFEGKAGGYWTFASLILL